MQHPLMKWAACIVLAPIGLFFLIMTYGALWQSKKTGRHISGVPFFGGVFIAAAFLLSPCKWLALLSLLDYGVWELPYLLFSECILHRKHGQQKNQEEEEHQDKP
jgi:hypothetical protein